MLSVDNLFDLKDSVSIELWERLGIVGGTLAFVIVSAVSYVFFLTKLFIRQLDQQRRSHEVIISEMRVEYKKNLDELSNVLRTSIEANTKAISQLTNALNSQQTKLIEVSVKLDQLEDLLPQRSKR